jgi:hypothetical protein
MQQRQQIFSRHKAQRHSPGFVAASEFEIAAQDHSQAFGVAMQGRLSSEGAVFDAEASIADSRTYDSY